MEGTRTKPDAQATEKPAGVRGVVDIRVRHQSRHRNPQGALHERPYKLPRQDRLVPNPEHDQEAEETHPAAGGADRGRSRQQHHAQETSRNERHKEHDCHAAAAGQYLGRVSRVIRAPTFPPKCHGLPWSIVPVRSRHT